MESLSRIAEWTQGTLTGPSPQWHPRGICTDSRSRESKTDLLFVALTGPNHNGHRYIEAMYLEGCRAFLVSEPMHGLPADAHVILVEDTLKALQNWAAAHRATCFMPVIGITGSNGKTIVKEWLYSLLHADFSISRSPGSYNSQLGVALSVLAIQPDQGLAILESGISKPGEMEKLEPMIRPNLVVFTNLGPAHDEGFRSSAQKLEEKLKLAQHADVIVCGADQEEVVEAISALAKKHFIKVISWSFHNPGATLRVIKTKQEGLYTRVEVMYKSSLLTYRIPFTDKASIENSLTCLGVLLALERPDAEHLAAFEQLEGVAMRMELKKSVQGGELLCDYYNNDPASLAIALDYLSSHGLFAQKTLILSDLPETGPHPEKVYGQVEETIKSHAIQRVHTVGPYLKAFGLATRFGGKAFEHTEAFMATFDTKSLGAESILLKGARRFSFERIADMLAAQRHPTRLDIRVSAMAHNLAVYRNRLPRGTKLMVMVKAFAYGGGLIELARFLQFHRVDYLGVAYADEGVQLRQAGISLPIMVMNPEPSSLRIMADHKLEPDIYSEELLNQWIALGTHHPLPPFHLEFDTGMHRLGFEEQDVATISTALQTHKFLHLAGVFSHLASADDHHAEAFTRYQQLRFESICHALSQATQRPFMRHLANSSGIVAYPSMSYDMVRLGIGLHGIDPTGLVQEHLQPVHVLRTMLSQVKQVKAGEPIGYNGRTVASKDMTIAIAAIGYADGLPRLLGNGVGQLYIKGQPAPIVGSVCMDMCMIDVSGLDAKEGDEAIVFGSTEQLLNLARLENTIPYEVLTRIGQRVSRQYVQE